MRTRSSFAFPFAALLTFIVVGVGFPLSAKAQDFFGSFGDPAATAVSHSPFDQASGSEEPQTRIIVRPPVRRDIGHGTRAFCVRTCDGRYFPIASGTRASTREFCRNACPAAETQVYSGGSIETATAEGKPYSKIANAFRYRTEFVSGCSCQSDGRMGLAHIRIEDDKTIRIGDIVANANGLMVASGAKRRGIIFTRVQAARLKAERLPAVSSR